MLSASQWTSTKSTSICGGPSGPTGMSGPTGPTQTIFNDGIAGLQGLVGSGENPGNGGGGGVIGLSSGGSPGIGFSGNGGAQGTTNQGVSGISNRGVDGISRDGLQRTGPTGPQRTGPTGPEGSVGADRYPSIRFLRHQGYNTILNYTLNPSDVNSIFVVALEGGFSDPRIPQVVNFSTTAGVAVDNFYIYIKNVNYWNPSSDNALDFDFRITVNSLTITDEFSTGNPLVKANTFAGAGPSGITTITKSERMRMLRYQSSGVYGATWILT